MKEVLEQVLFKLCFYCLLAMFVCMVGQAKISYIPKIVNYSVNDYKAGNQNWAISQAPDGRIFVGNNRGLLVFDGIHWDLVKLPNNLAVRALYISKGGRIYVGSFEEFGYFEMGDSNDFVYHSLNSPEISDFMSNDEFWTINEHQGKIYFQSFRNLFVYDGHCVKRMPFKENPLYLFSLDNNLYIQFMNGGGFYRLDGERLVELVSSKSLPDDIVSVLPFGNQLLLVSVRHGCYLFDKVTKRLAVWDIAANELLKRDIANRGVMTKDSTYIVGTISNGIVAIDKRGELLWHINRENGLINNTVLKLDVDQSDNLWASLDNGIAQIHVNSPIYFYEPFEAQIGMIHDMVIEKDIVYLASNQGLYALSEKDKFPVLVPGTQEQTWYISDVGNQIIVGHNTGTLQLEGRRATLIPGPTGGGTALRKAIIHGKEVLLQTSYSPLSVFVRDMQTNRWAFSHNVEGFADLIKSFEVDPTGNIWASHMYKGIFDFSMVMQGVTGNQIVNRKRGDRRWHSELNYDADQVENRWTGEGSTNSYPSAAGSVNPWNIAKFNSFYVEDGSYFRIQNVQLAYTFPKKDFGKFKMPSIRLSLTADRPLTFFKANSFSPELSSMNGFDERVYPLSAAYTFGLRIIY